MHRIEEMTVTLEKPGRKARTFTLPVSLGREVEDFIANGLKEAKGDSQLIAAEKVLPELADSVLGPAAILRGSRYKADLTQKELADRLGVRQHHLSEMENGKRPIGKEMAKRLAEALECDYRVFI